MLVQSECEPARREKQRERSSQRVERLIAYGLGGSVLIGLLMIGLSGDVRPWVMAGPFMLFGFAHALISNNTQAAAVSIRPQYAGAAAGFMGFMQMTGGGLAIMGFAVAQIASVLPIAILMTIMGGGGLLLLRRVLGRSNPSR